MIPLALLCGAGTGAGLMLLVSSLRPPAPTARELLVAMDPAQDVGPSLASRLTDQLQQVRPVPRASDLLVLERSLAQHRRREATAALAGIACVGWCSLMLARVDVVPPATVPVLAAAGAAAGLLPAHLLVAEAERRRADLRAALAGFLELVAMGVAAGRGLGQALTGAARLGRGQLFEVIADALHGATLTGQPVESAFARLGGAYAVQEFDDLALTLRLSGQQGAPLRDTLRARAEGLRARELSDMERSAQERSEAMTAPPFVVLAGYLLFLLYPAVMTVLSL